MNLATLRGATHISRARCVGCVGQPKRWATEWKVGSLAHGPLPRELLLEAPWNGASSSSRNGAKRGRFGKTGAAVVRLGSCFASLLASRPLRMLWYEAWRVALMGNGRLRLGDWGVRVGGRIELLSAQFKVRPQGENPSLCSEVGCRCLLMATGRDPQSLVLDHLKYVQVWWGHLGEPDGKGIFKDGAHDGLISGHQGFGCEAPVWPS